MNEINEQTRKKIAGYLGIAQRAGRVAAGDAMAKDSLVKGKSFLLIIANDAAPKVKEELMALADEDVPVLIWPDKYDLGLIIGKSRRGAVSLNDEGLAKAILKLI